MRRNKDNEWKPSIRKIGGRHYIDMIELETFFDVRAEMRSQELDEWFSNHDFDDPGVAEVGAEIDGSIEELDYLVKVLRYLRSSHILNSIKTVDDLERAFGRLDKTTE